MLFLQLLLQDGGLHADINGDGVLDHVQVRQSTMLKILELFMGINLFQGSQRFTCVLVGQFKSI